MFTMARHKIVSDLSRLFSTICDVYVLAEWGKTNIYFQRNPGKELNTKIVFIREIKDSRKQNEFHAYIIECSL